MAATLKELIEGIRNRRISSPAQALADALGGANWTFTGTVNFNTGASEHHQDNIKTFWGTGDDLSIYHDGTNSIIENVTNHLQFLVGGSERLRITSAGTVFLPADNQTLELGAGEDLKLYHDGTNSYIENQTGLLQLRTNSTNWISLGQTGIWTHVMSDDTYSAIFRRSGATNNPGIFIKAIESSVTGVIDASGSAGSFNMSLRTGGVERMNLASGLVYTSDGTDLVVGNSSPVLGRGLEVVGTAGDSFITPQRYSADASSASLEFCKSRNATKGSHTIVQSGDNLGHIQWYGSNGSSFSEAARITGSVGGTPGASNDMPGQLSFYTSNDGSSTVSEKLRITAAGTVFLPIDSQNIQLGAGQDLRLFHNGTDSIINNLTGSLKLQFNGNDRIACNTTGIGFYATAPVAKPTVTGAKGGNAALGSLMTALANLGLVTDSTTA